MMTLRISCAAAALLLTCLLSSALHAGPPATGDAAWVRVDTANFVVFGESSEKRTREVAAEFERFREALSRVLAGAVTRSAVPTIVVAFDTRKSFEPYRPTFNGKPVALAGFFRATEDQNLVALADEDRASALRIIFHEYTHLVTANVSRELPAWLTEGMAEYYSTFLVSPNGREATLGHVIPSHLRLLNENPLLPLEQLLAVDRSSAMYNEGQRRSLFYAQSWALVHFLVSGEPNRSEELTKYLRATASGTSALDAWREIFGTLDAVAAIKRYVTRSTMRGFTYKFSERIEKVDGRAVPLSAADTEAALADLLRRGAEDDAAAARLEKAVAMQPSSSRARALLGLIHAREGRGEEAHRLLVAAAADADWLVQYHVASGMTLLLAAADTAARGALAEMANGAVDAVLAARPDLPHALALRAHIAEAGGGDLVRAVSAIRRARDLAPGRDDYAFLEAHLLEQQGDFAAARGVLGPLMSGIYPAHTRDRARLLMGRIVTRQANATRTAAAGPVAEESRSQPRAEPLYREVGSGELRTEGLLERIDCAKGQVSIRLRTTGGVEQFQAASLESIDFITYRTDLAGQVQCGARPAADRVYVTWRHPPSTTGASTLPTIVAIEFLR